MFKQNNTNNQTFQSIGEVIKLFLKGNEDALKRQKVYAAWHKVVGNKIASISRPAFYQQTNNNNGKLIIHVKSSDWLTNLTYSHTQILKNYQAFFPHLNIQEIKFRYKPNEEDSLYQLHRQEEDDNQTPQENITQAVIVEKPPPPQWHKQSLELSEKIRLWQQRSLEARQNSQFTTKTTLPTFTVSSPKTTNKPAYSTSKVQAKYPSRGIRSDFFSKLDGLQSFDLYE